MAKSASVLIQIEMPWGGDEPPSPQMVHSALRQVAQSYVESDGNLDAACCYGNWRYMTLTNEQRYQPTLWQAPTDEPQGIEQ